MVGTWWKKLTLTSPAEAPRRTYSDPKRPRDAAAPRRQAGKGSPRRVYRLPAAPVHAIASSCRPAPHAGWMSCISSAIMPT